MTKQSRTNESSGRLWCSVHRLDKVTSGVLLFAKSEAAAAALSAQFQRRAVHKYYVALSGRRGGGVYSYHIHTTFT